MTEEEVAVEIYGNGIDEICKWKCMKEAGNKYTCPYSEEGNVDTEICLQCVKEWLNSEVLEDGK
jgi:hypothetical protein